MLSELKSIRVRFTALILTGLLLAPLAGLASALLFGLIAVGDLSTARAPAVLATFVAASTLWALFYFSSYFSPLSDWLGRRPGAALPTRQQRRLARFSQDYWSFFLLYALATPALLFVAIGKSIGGELGEFLQLVLLQLSVAILVGLPSYQLALDQIGKLAGHLSLQKIHVSLKSKVMLLGGFVPLLSYSVLMNYHWQQTGNLTPGHMAIWLTLVVITGMITLFSIRSITQALAPVQEIFQRSGASSNTELAQLSPQSTDEIGFMTQALGKLFRRLGEQETHMRAVVENAAEGIIVVDEQGRVETFNPAAEKLFGYLAAEICQRPLKWLLPDLVDAGNRLRTGNDEYELEGYHRNGVAMQLSVRISEMDINGQHLYTCLVADITRRKATEDKLREAESRYRDLVETAHDLVWTMDNRGQFTYVNRACLDIYGFEPAEMLTRQLQEFRSPDHPPVDQEAIGELLAGKERVKFETVHLDAESKPHFLSFSAKTHTDETGKLIQ
ncbi:MAG: PAS domain S-box protein, partial [Gammaproteobacteria bacterium]|nr:PAS domain S-box protein [Gammaproteobacteria bacterium]